MKREAALSYPSAICKFIIEIWGEGKTGEVMDVPRCSYISRVSWPVAAEERGSEEGPAPRATDGAAAAPGRSGGRSEG